MKHGVNVARWIGYPEVAFVLEAGDAWRDRCFVGSGSIFTDRSLWTLDNLHDLVVRQADNPIYGSRDFFDKLKEQLAGAPSAVVQLAAEVLWFLHLFPSKNTLKPSTKREQVETVWSWSGESAPASLFLDDAHLDGVGHPGTAYLTYRPAEFEYVLRMTIAFKALPADKRRRLMQDDVPWSFVGWLDEQPGSDRRLARGALLYFLFPDYLERNLSRDHKQQIYSALKDKLPADQVIKSRTPKVGDYDRAIALIRSAIEQERGTIEVDFYDENTKGLWFTQLRESSVKEFTSWMNTFFKDRGLLLNQPGRDLRSLDEKRAIDPATGFWRNVTFVTGKPPRWLIHFDITGDNVTAAVPEQHRAAAIGYANTKGGDSGALAVRVLPVVRVDDHEFREVERWEWVFLLCFPSGLEPGSSGEAFDQFDVAAGTLTYLKRDQPYIFAGLLCLNAPDEQVSFEIRGTQRTLSYQDATDALQNLIKVTTPGGSDE